MIPNRLGLAARSFVVIVAAAAWVPPSAAAGALPVQSGTPSAPQYVTATVVDPTIIDLDWDPPVSNGGSLITGYRIEVSVNGGIWSFLASTAASVTAFRHSGFSATATHRYRVLAENANGLGPAAEATTVGTGTPSEPRNLTATTLGSIVDLDWDAPAPNGGRTITHYEIHVSVNGGSWTWVVDTATGVTAYRDATAAVGGVRRYRVRAWNANGQGAPAYVTATTVGSATPSAPLNLRATTLGSIVDLAWTAPATNGGRAITHYEIHVSVNAGIWTPVVHTAAGVTAYRDATAAVGVVRHYRVRAWNANGQGAPAYVTATTVGAGIPTAPLNLTATAVGPSVVDLDWDAPFSNRGRAITRYEIHVSVSGGLWTLLANRVASVTAYRDTSASVGAVRRYRVRAVNINGPGVPAYVVATAVRPPGPPRGLTATASGSMAIDLDWRAPLDRGSSAIIGYWIEVSTDEGDTWSTRERDTGSTATRYRHTGLSAGTTRHYRVYAINANGTGDPSNVSRATTDLRAPGVPRRLSATARGTSTIVLAWTAPSSDGGSPVTGYRIEWSRTGSSPWTEADTGSRTTGYTHSGLSPGTKRYYRVAAINRAGTGAWSSVVHATTNVTIPGAPTGLTARPSGVGGSTQLFLTWTRPATDGGSAITGYLIQMSPNGVSGWTQVVADTRSAGTSYLHTGLVPGTTRYYRVAAINRVDRSVWSNVAPGSTNAGRPGPPLNLRAHAGGPTSITLSWDAPASDGGARITGYSIRRRSPNDGTWITIQRNTNSPATTFTDPGLQPATVYRYQVRAINSEGPGPLWSPEASEITHPDLPSAPFNLTARADGTSQIDLSWSAPRNTGGAPILGYRIEASDDGGGTWRIIRRNTNSTTTSFSDLGLEPATTRHYRVAATNTAGTGPASTVRHATTDATLPGAPRNLTAEADGTSEIDLAWQAPTADGGANVTGYRIEVSEDGGANWENLVTNTRNTRATYSHSGLEPATTRHYRVSAINRIGVSRASSIESATTDATVPDAPTGLVATATTPTQIDLAWVAPDYDGGAPITGHRIEVSETGATWTDLQPNTGIASPTFTHPGLLPGSTRFYRVSAINRAGTGAASGVASAATDDPVERAGRLNTRVLPHVAAAMTSSTVSAIARRVDAVANGMGMERRVETNGLSSMAASLSSPGAGGVGLGRQDRSGLSSLFGGASFQMPFGATDAPQATSTGTRMGSWGAGEYHYLGEPGSSILDWSGNMVSAHVGVDGRLASDMLAGLAASYSSGTFDFTDRTGASPVTGTYATTMTSVNPYLAWFSGDRGNAVWGSAGYGWGDIEVDDEREALRTSPVRSVTGAAGGSYQLLESGIGGVRVKAEGWAGQVMVDGGERVDSVTLAMQRGKLALEWTQGFRSTAGHEVAIVLEGGMRYDNGDGVNGTSGEVGGGLRYTNADLGVTAEGRGRLLVSARDGYEEWGVGGMILFDPAARGQGLSIRLAPSYGDAASGVNQLWERGVSGAVRDHDMGPAANLDGEVAYGVAGFQGTPYSGFYLAENGVRAFSSGVRYDLGAGLGLRLEGTRRESGFGAAEHSVGIRGRVRFR